jgi:hypothetical protein
VLSFLASGLEDVLNLQKMRFFRLALFAAAVAAAVASLLPSLGADIYGPYQDTKGEGKALVQDVLSRMPADNTEIAGLLKIRPAEGPIREVPIKTIVRVQENAWQDIYQTQPVNGQPGQILLIQHFPGKPNRYLYAEYRDKSEEPKLHPIDGSQLYQPLGGSDFFLADLGLEFLHWPSQKIVRKEMRKSRSCRVVESINPNPQVGPYSRVLTWLDFETGNIIRAEGYDQKNRELKEFSIRKISRTEGKVQVKEMEITNEQTESRTRLEFNLEIPLASEH